MKFPNFENAPDELRQAAVKFNTAIKRVRKAREQRLLWEKESINAEAEMAAIEKSYHDLIMRWDPDTGEIKVLEELRNEAGKEGMEQSNG